MNWENKKVFGLFVLIITISVFFRVWMLDSTPPGLYPDIAMNGTNALEAIETGDYKVFYKDNNGREGLFMNLIALSFQVFGVHLWSLRLVGALIGILTVIGTYFLTKEVLSKHDSKTNIALLTTFFTAVSFWHVNFSRIGFRAILVPFVMVWCFYFLLRWWEHLVIVRSEATKQSRGIQTALDTGGIASLLFSQRRTRLWLTVARNDKIVSIVLAGIFFGLGFHTYIAFRFVPFIVIILAFAQLIYLLKNKYYKNIAQWLTGYIVFGLAALLVMLPLISYFYQNPEDIMGRAAQVSIFEQPKPLMSLGESLIKTAGMFNIYGDPNWRHNYSGGPLLYWPIGIFFIIGIVLSIKQVFKSQYKILDTKYNILLLTWVVLILAPSYLTAEGLPHALRSIGAIPPVMIWSGIGAWYVYNKLKSKVTSYKLQVTNRQLKILSFTILALITFHEFKRYFYDWGQNPEVRNAFSQNLVDVGNFIKNIDSGTDVYVIVNEGGVHVDGVPVSAQTVKFIYSMDDGPVVKPKVNYILPEKISEIETSLSTKTVIVPERYDEDVFDELWTRFKGGTIENKDSVTYFVIN